MMIHLKLFEFIDMRDGIMYFFSLVWYRLDFFHLFLFLVMVLLNLLSLLVTANSVQLLFLFFMLLDSPCGDCILVFLFCV